MGQTNYHKTPTNHLQDTHKPPTRHPQTTHKTPTNHPQDTHKTPTRHRKGPQERHMQDYYRYSGVWWWGS